MYEDPEEMSGHSTEPLTQNLVRQVSIGSKKKAASLVSTLITAVGNFSVQCNYQAISIALIVMSAEVCTMSKKDCKEGTQEAWVASTATATVFAGSIIGQLFMGYAGDVMGRSRAMAFTLLLAAISALCSAVFSMGDAHQVYTTIIVCRFFLGVGLGGVYPLSATKAAEDNATNKGANSEAAAWAFFWQTPGSMAPWTLAILLTTSSLSTDMRWRFLLGFGCIFSFAVVALTTMEVKTQRRKLSVSLDEVAAGQDAVSKGFRNSDIWWKLLGTGGSWFIFDVCYYGVGLFGGAILESMDGESDDVTKDDYIVSVAWKEIIALGMGIPGVFASIYLIRRKLHLKVIQILGFVLTAVCFLVMALSFSTLRDNNKDMLFALYCLLLFSLQFGPNVTTYVLPSSTFPSTVRSTMNGVSAACGKLGAVVGAYMFGAVAEVSSLPVVMIICAVLSLVGAVITHLYIHDHEDYAVDEGPDDVKSDYTKRSSNSRL